MNDQNITDEYINDTDVERMADDLAVDEMYSLSYADLQFVLKDLLRDKYHVCCPQSYTRCTETVFTTLIQKR